MRIRHLTIMFTDISGYTALSQKVSHEELQELLAEHERIVRAQADGNDGRVVKNLGDSFLIAYESTHGALSAAEGIHAEIAARNRRVPSDRAVALKIAVNAGDVSVDDNGDVFGDPVNVCARMEKVATGGETLFSEAVFLAMNRAEYRCEEFGHYNFKGVDYPVKVFRVVAPATGTQTVERAIVWCVMVAAKSMLDHSVERFERVLGAQDDTLFPAVIRHGGVVQTIMGDATLFTFERIENALECLLESVAEIARRNAVVPEPEQLRLRCAVHAGRVLYVRSRVISSEITVCEAIAMRTQPGQLSASETVRAALSERGSFAFAEIGEVEVFGEPVRYFDVTRAR